MKTFRLVLILLVFTSTYSQNDLCVNAIEVFPSTTCTTITGSFNGATITDAAPACASSTSQDVWYKFTATEKMLGITLNGTTGISNGFEVFSNSCNGASIICRNANNASGSNESILYNEFVIGTTYYLRIFNAFVATSTESFSFCIVSYPAPPNESCADAITLTPNQACNAMPVVLSGSTLDGAVSTSCSPNPSQDVWYKFVATDQVMSITLSTNVQISNGFEVYQNSCAGNLVICRNANGSSAGEFLSWSGFIIGETYYIRVLNEFVVPTTSGFNICVRNYPPPANDLCQNATTIPVGATCTVNSVDLSGATLDGVTSITCSPNPSQDVWYKFIASNSSMTITISQAIDISNGFQVYENGCNGTMLVCRNNNGNGQGETFTYNSFTIGNEYYIRVVNEYITPLSTSSFNICVVDATLSSENFQRSEVIIYPNPVQDLLTIETDEVVEQVDVINCAGQIVLHSKEKQFSIKELPQGLYWLKIKLSSGQIISEHKIIKE